MNRLSDESGVQVIGIEVSPELELELQQMTDNGATQEEVAAYLMRLFNGSAFEVGGAAIEGFEPEEEPLYETEVDNEIGLCEEVCRTVRMGCVFYSVKAKLVGLDVFPTFVGALKTKYKLLNSPIELTITQVSAELKREVGGGLASRINKDVEEIIQGKKDNPNFLLADNRMEVLRKLLFMVNSVGLKEKHLCDYGIDIMTDLKRFVAEYETKQAGILGK
jgi:hypothetical protein